MYIYNIYIHAQQFFFFSHRPPTALGPPWRRTSATSPTTLRSLEPRQERAPERHLRCRKIPRQIHISWEKSEEIHTFFFWENMKTSEEIQVLLFFRCCLEGNPRRKGTKTWEMMGIWDHPRFEVPQLQQGMFDPKDGANLREARFFGIQTVKTWRIVLVKAPFIC